MKKQIPLIFVLFMLLQSCAVVKQDEVAIKRKNGRLKGEPKTGGAYLYNPLFTSFLEVPIRTVNMKENIDIPSKEGLTISSEMAILYRIDKNRIKDILINVGENYEEDLIAPVFRSAIADVSAKYMAKDMHTGERAQIENAVKDMMMETLGPKGFIIENVLMKRIILPQSLSKAIEDKLAAEQEAQRMEFVLQRERQEAERRKIEAQGISEAQFLLSQGLTDAVLRYRAIEAFREMSMSPNAKVIFSNSMLPMLLDEK
jgi:regulator of protease activity HflC (stomatin/prohibitin superfamily)